MPTQPASFGDWVNLPEVLQINNDALALSMEGNPTESEQRSIYNRLLQEAYDVYLATF